MEILFSDLKNKKSYQATKMHRRNLIHIKYSRKQLSKKAKYYVIPTI